MGKRHWAVTVEVDGEKVLTIESEHLSGVPNIDDYRDEVVTAAKHLLSFMGYTANVEPLPVSDFTPT